MRDAAGMEFSAEQSVPPLQYGVAEL